MKHELKKGVLVKHVRVSSADEPNIGVILEKMHCPVATDNDVFKIGWINGTIGKYIWDYDLCVIEEEKKPDAS